MKKLIISIICLVLFFSVTASAEESKKINVKLDGIAINFEDQQPVIKDGRTLVPVRGIFEKMGLAVDWDESRGSVVATNEGKKIELIIYETKTKVDGKEVDLDVPAQIIGNRTMVPLRFVGESCDLTVDWDDGTSTVSLDKSLFHKIYKDGLYELVDNDEKVIIEPRYTAIGGFNAGFAIVTRDGKKGYINKKGKEIIECKYEDSYNFIAGIATVKLNGKWGVIDTNGKVVIDFKYDTKIDFAYKDITAVMIDGEIKYIDRKGNILSNDIQTVKNTKYDAMYDANEGMYAVQLDGKWGFINEDGKETVKCKYNYVDSFYDGVAVVSGNGWGAVNKEGKEITGMKYGSVSRFSEGLALVTPNGFDYGYINTNGEEIIPIQYASAQSFNGGIAVVCSKENWKYGCIDKEGKVVVDFKYDDFSYFRENGLAVIKLNGKYGFMDSTGKEVVECKYDWVNDYSEGLASVESNGKFGYVNLQGIEVIPCQYDMGYPFDKGRAGVELNNDYFYIDRQGNRVN
ncbi:MAG TPA: hypothetical protein DEP72_07580 [Clostridiales bacterium]|nr:MAG: hypothetical protein A2Y18_07055 [Clostridiales bacterium GWD2_32_19]HCC07996.1 hypothetical protein [Clostridiales bacterium]